MEEELKAEQTAAAASREGSFGYAAYAKAAIARRAKLAASSAEVKEKINLAAAEVTEGFQELKRLEIAQEHREKAERQRADKAEQAMLDELGLARHRRGVK